MFGSEILEIIIGLVFIYWLLSLLCSGINELISSITSMRAKNLEKGIRSLLDDPKGIGLAKDFYNHNLIRTIKRGQRNPSYISPSTFALTIMDCTSSNGFGLEGRFPKLRFPVLIII